MARFRTIKPELWTDEAFVECSSNARLLFVAGLNFASDYGILPDSPKQLKMQCFPGDNIDVEPLIEELLNVDLWWRVKAPDGTNVLLIRTFSQHQRVDRPTEGRYGNPDDWDEIRRVLDEDSTNGRRPLVLERKKERSNDHVESFASFWEQYPRKEAKKKAEVCWRNMTKAEREAALEALPAHVRSWQGRQREHIPHPTTWLNQARWEDEIDAAAESPTVEVDGVTLDRSAR